MNGTLPPYTSKLVVSVPTAPPAKSSTPETWVAVFTLIF